MKNEEIFSKIMKELNFIRNNITYLNNNDIYSRICDVIELLQQIEENNEK